MFPKYTLGVVFSLVILLTGCGQKGELYMPSQKPPPTAVKSQQKIEQSSEQPRVQAEENKLSEQDAPMP